MRDHPADAVRCGEEQRPEYDVIPKGPLQVIVQTRPAGLAYKAAQARIDMALRASADPFDRAVADLLNVGDMRTAPGAVDAVIQDALASSDPRIYSLAAHACVDAEARSGPLIDGPPPPASCQSLNPRYWASIDPDNGVPWTLVYEEARVAGDAAAKVDAVAHLAAATRFEDRPFIAAAAVLKRASANPDEVAALDDLAERGLWLNHFVQMPVSECRSASSVDFPFRAQCETIATTMFDHSDLAYLRARGATLTLYTTGNSSRRDVVRSEGQLAAARDKAMESSSPCSQTLDKMRQLLRGAQVGEVQARVEAGKRPTRP